MQWVLFGSGRSVSICCDNLPGNAFPSFYLTSKKKKNHKIQVVSVVFLQCCVCSCRVLYICDISCHPLQPLIDLATFYLHERNMVAAEYSNVHLIRWLLSTDLVMCVFLIPFIANICGFLLFKSTGMENLNSRLLSAGTKELWSEQELVNFVCYSEVLFIELGNENILPMHLNESYAVWEWRRGGLCMETLEPCSSPN